MTKVWIIQKAAEDIVGVYTTEQLAKEALAKFRMNSNYPHHYEYDEYDVKNRLNDYRDKHEDD